MRCDGLSSDLIQPSDWTFAENVNGYEMSEKSCKRVCMRWPS